MGVMKRKSRTNSLAQTRHVSTSGPNYSALHILCLGEMMPTDGCSYRIRFTETKKIAEQGHAVTFITPHQKQQWCASKALQEDGLRVIFSPGWAPTAMRRGGFSLLDMLYKVWMVLTLEYDVLHVTCGHRPAQLVPALAARFLKRRPTVDEWWEWYGRGGRAEAIVGLKGRVISIFDCLFELPAKGWYSAVLAISSKLKQRLKANSHVHVLHGGVEVDHLAPGNKEEARRRLGLSSDLFLIGLSSTGRADHPDVLPFLRAFRVLAKQEPRLRLFVTGEKDYVRKEFIGKPGGDKVIYKGWLELDEYSFYLRACDVFVLPLGDVPRNAGRWPHKLGDFLYFERPIITNPIGDIPKLFKGKQLGFLCPNEQQAYYDLLENLLGGVKDLVQACLDSRKTAIGLSSDKRVESLIRIYKSLYIK